MKLEYEHKEILDDIAEEVCKYFNVEEQDIVNINKKEKPSNARFFLWYILHYELRISTSEIANIYVRKKRNVQKGISKIRCGLRTQSYYKIIYDELMKRIHPIIPKDWDRIIEGYYGNIADDFSYRKA